MLLIWRLVNVNATNIKNLNVPSFRNFNTLFIFVEQNGLDVL